MCVLIVTPNILSGFSPLGVQDYLPVENRYHLRQWIIFLGPAYGKHMRLSKKKIRLLSWEVQNELS